MTQPRREFLQGLAVALASSAWLSDVQAASNAPAASAASSGHDMSQMPASWTGKEQIAMLLYPQFTALDFVGPQYMLASLMGATVHHVAKGRKPVTSDTGLGVLPTATFKQCPKDLDILFVPGGSSGTLAAIADEETLAFLADRGSRAKLVTSVCTGSLLLGAAGLLKGYRATSHWATRELLPLVGATAVDERVVQDRNRITGAGVSAGLDLGLTIVGLLRDRTYAETVQLLAEYAPQPPYSAGSDKTAPAEVKAIIDGMFTGFIGNAGKALRQARRAKVT